MKPFRARWKFYLNDIYYILDILRFLYKRFDIFIRTYINSPKIFFKCAPKAWKIVFTSISLLIYEKLRIKWKTPNVNGGILVMTRNIWKIFRSKKNNCYLIFNEVFIKRSFPGILIVYHNVFSNFSVNIRKWVWKPTHLIAILRNKVAFNQILKTDKSNLMESNLFMGLEIYRAQLSKDSMSRI